MDWRVFPIKAVLKLLNDRFVLERVTVKWDDETYGKSEGTRFVLCHREEVANIDHIKVCSSGFFHDTFVYYGDGLMLKLWQDNLNVDEEHERYSSNKLVSPLFSLYKSCEPHILNNTLVVKVLLLATTMLLWLNRRSNCLVISRLWVRVPPEAPLVFIVPPLNTIYPLDES